ncbi:RecX family transcriptional regulator [Flavobacterium salilacus subsp. salilacus]|uniref:regulatory protein RecX n=1 Tax=Flavobacterium TaxID=237 RepID=UPI0010757BBA|nr:MULTISPECIES: regulatory protein RecX [Flavobacterium]KAF2515464.1 RecX family transcriptional regulator [Flavobacterium salilacus subsp. salilacus]MBE1615862.1 RecX family transcriptional regulator [Flavobacterium sp. SaA2.13]
MLYKSYTVAEAQKKLEQYCAYQERCHEEVIQKLKSLNMIPQAIDSIVGHLLEHNFLNEERFARSFARGKFRIKHWGRIRIIRELKARQISRYTIDAALKEIDEQEYITAFNELALKQWDFVTESNMLKKKKKVSDFLMRKGYENQLVYEKIAELCGSNSTYY